MYGGNERKRTWGEDEEGGGGQTYDTRSLNFAWSAHDAV